MKREMWWRKGNNTVRNDTSQYVRNLFKTAYIGKVHPQEFDRLMSKLDSYLEGKGNAFGVRAFRRFSTEFKDAVAAAKDSKTGAFSSTPVKSEIAGNLQLVKNDRGHVDKPQTLARWEIGLKALSGQPDSVRLLGDGAEGAAFELKQAGQSLVYKGFFEPRSLLKDLPKKGVNQFTGDIGVARSRALLQSSRIAVPSEFVVSVGRKGDESGQTRLVRVPAEKLKGLVNALRAPGAQASENQAEIEVKQVGILMPKAAGSPVGGLAKAGAMSDTDIANVATGMTRALQELDSHNTALHDIKPDNLLYDPSSGKLKMIDLGLSQKLSKGGLIAEGESAKPTTTARRVGTEFYMAPDVARSFPGENSIQHGTEVDRYSSAVTLLELLAPEIGTDSAFRADAIDHSVWWDAQAMQPFPPEQYLDKWMERIEAKLPQAADTIRQKFQDNPDLKNLIHDAFCASARTPEGAQAWARMTSNPLLARTEQRLADELSQRFMLGVAQARDANAPAPTDPAGIILLSPETFKLENGVSVPREGVYRAGTEIRGELQSNLQAGLMSRAAQDNKPIEDLENDPRVNQMRLDLPRDRYTFENVAQGGERVVTSVQEFKDELSSQFAQLNPGPANSLEQRIVDRDRNRTLTDKALRDLSTFHHQGLAGDATGSTGMNYLGKHDFKRPWFGTALDHGQEGSLPRRSISPDPANPGSLLIGLSIGTVGEGSAIGGRPVVGQYPALAEDPGKRPVFSERLDIRLRYTPSEQAGQAGTISVLDIRNDFDLFATADVPPPEEEEVTQLKLVSSAETV
jgi:serine/threonine protein kinase